MNDLSAKRVCVVEKTNEEEFEFFLKVDENRGGQIITAITKDGPADRGGLKEEDRVLMIDGTDVADAEHTEVVKIIRDCIPRNKITFTVIDKENDPNAIRFKTEPKPRICKIKKKKNTFGFFLEIKDGDKQGHFIKEVVKGGPSDGSGLLDGDRLIAVNGNNVLNLSHDKVVDQVKKSGNKVTLLVIEEDAYKYLTRKGVKITEALAKPVKKSKSVSSTTSSRSSKSVSKTSTSQLPRSVSQSSSIELNIPEPPQNKVKIVHLYKPKEKGYGFYLRVKRGENKERIGNVEVGGVAHVSGLKNDDLLLGVNGELIAGLEHSKVVDMVKAKHNQVVLAVLDDKSQSHFESKTETLQREDLWRSHEHFARLVELKRGEDGYGFYLKMEANSPFHIIADVEEGGPADKVGLKDGEVISTVNGHNTLADNHEECVKRIKDAGDEVKVIVTERNSAEFFYKLGIEVNQEMLDYFPTDDEFILPFIKIVKAPSRRSSVSSEKKLVDVIEETKVKQELVLHRPRYCKVIKKDGGLGFFLRDENGHYFGNVEENGPAAQAGIRDRDRIIELNDKNVEDETHDQIVNLIRSSGDEVSFLVVDREADNFFKSKSIIVTSALLESAEEDQYTEVVKTDHYPRMCKLKKTETGFGFHLNGEVGREGQFIRKIVEGGAADVAGVKDGDRLIEVNGQNVEQESHDAIVQKIFKSGAEVTFLVVDEAAEKYFREKDIRICAALLKQNNKDDDTTSKASSIIETEAHVHNEDVKNEEVIENVAEAVVSKVNEDKNIEDIKDKIEDRPALDALEFPPPPATEEDHKIEEVAAAAVVKVVMEESTEEKEDITEGAEEVLNELSEKLQDENKSDTASDIQDVIENVVESEIVSDIVKDDKASDVEDVVEEVKEHLQEEYKEEIVEEIKEDVKEEIQEEIKENIQESVEEKVKEELKEEMAESIAEKVVEEIKETNAEENNKVDTFEKLENAIQELNDEIQEPVKEEFKEEVIEEIKEEKKEDIKEEIKKDVKKEVQNEIAEVVKEEIVDIVEDVVDEKREEKIDEVKMAATAVIAKSIIDEIKEKETDKTKTTKIMVVEEAKPASKSTPIQERPASAYTRSGPVFTNSRTSIKAKSSIFENGATTNQVNGQITDHNESESTNIDNAKKSLVASIRESIEKRNQNGNSNNYYGYRPPTTNSRIINPKDKSTYGKQFNKTPSNQFIPPKKQMSWTGDGMTINIVEINPGKK